MSDTQKIHDYIHSIQQRLELNFDETDLDENEPLYKHRFVCELLEDLKGAIEDIGNGKQPTDHIDKFIDSQFWDKT